MKGTKDDDHRYSQRRNSFAEDITIATASMTVKKSNKPHTLLNTNSSILAIEDSVETLAPNVPTAEPASLPQTEDIMRHNDNSAMNSMAETFMSKGLTSEDELFNSPFNQKMSSPANYHQSLDQYFLGGVNSSKNHLRTLKTITDNRPVRNKFYQSAMAPTATSLNNAMKAFKKQQAVL